MDPVTTVTTVTGLAVPLDRADVDTDQIIPAIHMKNVQRRHSCRSTSMFVWPLVTAAAEPRTMLIDECGYLGSRGSSSRAKKADAALRRP